MRLEREESFTPIEPEIKKPIQPGPPPPAYVKPGTESLFVGVLKKMDETAQAHVPDYYMKTKMVDLVRKARADKRRHDLLAKSLAEARERQKKDTVSLDDVDEVKEDSSTPADVPEARASKIGLYQPADDAPVVVSDDVMVSDDTEALTEKKTEKTGGGAASIMSITAVMRVKKALKEKPRRVRKIVSS